MFVNFPIFSKTMTFWDTSSLQARQRLRLHACKLYRVQKHSSGGLHT